MFRKTFLVALGAALPGCISIGTYEKKMEMCRDYQTQVETLQGEVAQLKLDKEALEEKYGAATVEIENKDAYIETIKGTYDQLVDELQSEIAEGQIKITQQAGGLTIAMEEKVLFGSGEAELKGAGQKVLGRVGQILKKDQGHSIRVDGHTDNIPISKGLQKKFPSNWDLSAARSANVVRFLQDKAGIEPKKLMIAAFAENKPLAPNDTPKGREQNRRVEITLLPLPTGDQ